MIGNEGQAPESCEDCGQVLTPQVLRSAAGYYIGTECGCGPYSRASDYFPTRESAEAELSMWDVVRPSARTPGFHPDPNFTVIGFDPADTIGILHALGVDE